MIAFGREYPTSSHVPDPVQRKPAVSPAAVVMFVALGSLRLVEWVSVRTPAKRSSR